MYISENSAEGLHNFLSKAQFTTSRSIIVFTGAGMSAESGISTFRDKGGLWEEHDIEEVATPQAWSRDREKVLDFYNMRRKQLLEVEPNKGHQIIAKMEKDFNLKVITQNIDDLHERAGSKKVLHLHGELRKSRSSLDENLIYPIEGSELKIGDKCEKGSQLRPHVVWFGEMVPAMDEAIDQLEDCGLMIVVGSSLMVYPAASLVQMVETDCPVIVIDPDEVVAHAAGPLLHLACGASEGLEMLHSVLKSF